jgi:hypothetical protein
VATDDERLRGEAKPETLVDWTEGMPTGHLNPFTPAGEIEQIGKFASGLTRLTGRRRTAARWAIVLLLLVVPVLAVVNAVQNR